MEGPKSKLAESSDSVRVGRVFPLYHEEERGDPRESVTLSHRRLRTNATAPATGPSSLAAVAHNRDAATSTSTSTSPSSSVSHSATVGTPSSAVVRPLVATVSKSALDTGKKDHDDGARSYNRAVRGTVGLGKGMGSIAAAKGNAGAEGPKTRKRTSSALGAPMLEEEMTMAMELAIRLCMQQFRHQYQQQLALARKQSAAEEEKVNLLEEERSVDESEEETEAAKEHHTDGEESGGSGISKRKRRLGGSAIQKEGIDDSESFLARGEKEAAARKTSDGSASDKERGSSVRKRVGEGAGEKKEMARKGEPEKSQKQELGHAFTVNQRLSNTALKRCRNRSHTLMRVRKEAEEQKQAGEIPWKALEQYLVESVPREVEMSAEVLHLIF